VGAAITRVAASGACATAAGGVGVGVGVGVGETLDIADDGESTDASWSRAPAVHEEIKAGTTIKALANSVRRRRAASIRLSMKEDRPISAQYEPQQASKDDDALADRSHTVVPDPVHGVDADAHASVRGGIWWN
jgi:hypothetical protein